MYEIIKISLICYMFCALGGDGKIFHWYRMLIEELPDWLYHPLGGCFMCFTGQVMFWYFLFTKPFDVIELGFFVSAGIMLSLVWDKLYEWLYQ